MGFDVVELPIEQLGDWSPEHAAEVLAEHGLGASIAVAMAPGRELCGADAETVATTQAFLRECLDVAATVGAGAIAGPIYLDRPDLADHARRARRLYAELRENLKPVAEHAGEVGVKIGIEPLVRYETSLINTVEQALEAIDPLPDSVGLLLDTYPRTWRRRTSPGRSAWAGRGSCTSTPRPTTAVPPAPTTSTGSASATRSANGLRRPDRDRVLHRRERDDRHRRFGVAPARGLAGRDRRGRLGISARIVRLVVRTLRVWHGFRHRAAEPLPFGAFCRVFRPKFLDIGLANGIRSPRRTRFVRQVVQQAYPGSEGSPREERQSGKRVEFRRAGRRAIARGVALRSRSRCHRRAGPGAGQARHALHGHDRLPAHGRDQRRAPDHPEQLEALGYTVDWEDCDQQRAAPARTTATTRTRIRGSSRTRTCALRRDRDAEHVVVVRGRQLAGSAAAGATEGRDHQVRPERRRHRGDPQRDGPGARGSRPGTGGTATARTRSSASPMPGHAATNPTGNIATVQVADPNHLSTKDLPDQWTMGTSTTTSSATSAATITCWRRSTSARTPRASTPRARITRSRGASSTTATDINDSTGDAEGLHATAACGSPAWVTSAPRSPSRAATTTWSR